MLLHLNDLIPKINPDLFLKEIESNTSRNVNLLLEEILWFLSVFQKEREKILC